MLSAEDQSVREAHLVRLAEMAEECRAEMERKRIAALARRPSRKLKTSPAAVLMQLAKVQRPRTSEAGSDGDSEDKDIVPEGRILIFDWDDTLLPTWFITDVIYPCHPEAKTGALPATSSYFEPLASHADIVKALLVAASAIGPVAIVTLARRDWVMTSAERFLPGIDWRELFSELEISVLYAREHLARKHAAFAQVEDGVNPFVLAKRNAMAKFVRRWLRERRGSRLNVISVGDSLVEQEAVKEVLWSLEGDPKYSPMCKTVKLMDDPPLCHLTGQLTIISAWIHRLFMHDGDFDLNLEDPHDVELKMSWLTTS